MSQVIKGFGWIALLAVCFQRFLLNELLNGPFIDEIYVILASLNLMRFGIYSPEASSTVGFEFSVSSGILATWPTGLGFLLSGTLFGARLLFWVWVMVLYLVASYQAMMVTKSKSQLSFIWVAPLFFLVTLTLIPYTESLAFIGLGELPGALLIAIAFLLGQRKRIYLAATVFGLAIWHAKFMYFPFAALWIFYSCWRARALSRSLKLISLFFLPLIVWNALILSFSGVSGYSKYLADQYLVASSIFMNYTVGVGGYHPPRGLLNRLTSPELEWVRYRAIDQFKILLMAILPLAVCAYWARGFRLSKSTFMEFNFISGLAAVLMAFNYWYFWLHHRMWIRHFVPSLCMGLWVVVFFVVVRWRGSDRFSQWGRLIVTVILSLIVGREALKVPNFLAMVRDPSYSVRYSKICSVSNPLEATNLEILNACQLGDLGFR